MDIPRPFAARRRRIRQTLYLLTALVSIAAISAGLSRLEPAAPRVDRSTLWMGEVKKGDLTRRVRGLGKLIPEVIRWIPAATQGRVERVLIQPGERVTPETLILELSNPELEQQALDAESQLKRSEAELAHLRIQLENENMQRQADVARVESQYLEATLKAEADAALLREGLVSEMDTKISRSRAEALETQRLLEKRRMDIFAKSLEAQLEAKEAEVEQRRLLHGLRRSQLGSLKVRPGISGVLQQVEVDVGQHVTPGTNLIRIAEPRRLKAEIEVAATQARDLEVGQKAEIDTRNGVVPGRVSRIDPAVKEGLVTVDVALEGKLPRGARPDLSVDGTVELEHLADVVYMPRPGFSQEDGSVSLFRIEPDGIHAQRVRVDLGASSVSEIQILEGLAVGDQVVLSDMAQWKDHDRVRLQ